MIILVYLTQFSKEFIGRERNYCHRKQTHRNEAPKMRKVRNSGFSSNNPALMFSRGVEQIVSDHMTKQPRCDDYELLAIERSPVKERNSVSLFGILIQQLFWSNASRKA